MRNAVCGRSKAKNAQEAHEAIRPTKPAATPERCGLPLRAQLARLYALIWARALASQMAPAAMLQVCLPCGKKHVHECAPLKPTSL